jgi:hypothetical protein
VRPKKQSRLIIWNAAKAGLAVAAGIFILLIFYKVVSLLFFKKT